MKEAMHFGIQCLRIYNAQLWVVVGDQMMCKNIRSARTLTQPEINPLKTVEVGP